MYKDEKTGIEFGTWDYTPDASDDDDPGFGAYKFGMALPADAMTKDATEYIGILVSANHNPPSYASSASLTLGAGMFHHCY
jgi:cellobiose dehydrogenase (acceptor)